jgi:hypothetical protein
MTFQFFIANEKIAATNKNLMWYAKSCFVHGGQQFEQLTRLLKINSS